MSFTRFYVEKISARSFAMNYIGVIRPFRGGWFESHRSAPVSLLARDSGDTNSRPLECELKVRICTGQAF